ncbi:sarcosine oxidase subunit gamma [Phytoactinopolyspora mesophila]|nr:sarcosine oxidase subunit gamma family protein [Phytoactinopolyspora mesophila]
MMMTDCTSLAKLLIRAEPGGAHDVALGVPLGRAVRVQDGVLAVRTVPDAWMLLTSPDSLGLVQRRMQTLADGTFASVVDVSHGYTLARLTGTGAASVLARVCSMNLTHRAMPDGTAFRTLVAGVVATVIRDDENAAASYLVQCDRSYGRYMMDVLTDAAAGAAVTRH